MQHSEVLIRLGGMRDFLVLFLHLIVTVARLARPGGLRSVVAESALVRYQLLILSRGCAWRIDRSRGYRSLEQPSTVTLPPVRIETD